MLNLRKLNAQRCNFSINSCFHLHKETRFLPSRTVTEEFLRCPIGSDCPIASLFGERISVGVGDGMWWGAVPQLSFVAGPDH